MKTTILLIFVAVFFCILSSCKQPVDNRVVVATVGDQALTIDELMAEIPPHIRPNLTSGEIREFVLRWINKQVLYQEAVERNLDEAPDVRQELEKLKKELMINKLMELTVDNRITVTEADIEAYYEANKERFILEEDIAHAYHIVVQERSDANAIRARLNKGEDFEIVFREVHQDTLDGEWDLGYFSRGQVIPELANNVFKMREGRVSLPIKSKFGYHVIQLVDLQKEGEIRPLEDVKNEIRQILEARKQQDLHQRFTLQVKSKFNIQTNFQLLESSIMDSLLAKGE